MRSSEARSIALGQLMPGVDLLEQLSDIPVTGIQLDSRAVQSGDAFIAVPGEAFDGRQFVGQAFKAGASVVLAEAEGLDSSGELVLPVENLLCQASAIAARFYGDPSRSLSMTGVTGTNGKTTCTQLLGQLFGLLGQNAGVVGTLGYGIMQPGGSTLVNTGMTTPDAVAVQAILAELVASGTQQVAMEVSSHSLSQGRVAAVHFDTAIFTNLSQDHLDYHGSMESYAAAKAKLFEMPGVRCAIINIDDTEGSRLAGNLREGIACYRYSTGSDNADIFTRNVELEASGIRAEVVTPWGQGELQSRLLGEFNLSNLLAVIAAACVQGFSLEEVLQAVPELRPVEGRMELVDSQSSPQIVVDYAHTPDALEQALRAVRAHCKGKLWCVFGCGGDRDQGKRPLMGEVATRLADHVVVTSDNPRTEEPLEIIDDIVQGASSEASVQVDRREAIEYAIVRASDEDTVLLAGKGHEDYQLIGDTRLPFSDIMQARLALRRRGG